MWWRNLKGILWKLRSVHRSITFAFKFVFCTAWPLTTQRSVLINPQLVCTEFMLRKNSLSLKNNECALCVANNIYRLNLFGCVALKHILFDLNEFRILVGFAIIFYHEESLIQLKIGVLAYMIYFLQKQPNIRKCGHSNDKFSLFFFFQFSFVLACFWPLDQNGQKSVIFKRFYVHKNPLRWEKY